MGAPSQKPKDRPTKLQGIGIPFISAAEWDNAKRQMQDPQTLPDTHAQYLQAIEQGERQLRARGFATIRVPLIVEDFVDWCRKTGRQIDTKARSDYAAIKAMEMDQRR